MREKKPVNLEIGANIQREREKAGYTQEQLSELLGLTPNHLSAIERGVSGISLESLQKLCLTLNISADRILFGKAPEGEQIQNIIRKLSSIDLDTASDIAFALYALIKSLRI